MGKAVHHHPLDALQGLPKRRVVGQVATQDQGVDEEANQGLGLAVAAARYRCADHNIVLPAMAVKQDLERG